MPKRNIPNYRLHKATGQAFVELGGRRFYLGKHGSKASKEGYEQRIAEYLANGRKMPPMCRIQRNNTMRPQDVCNLRACDIDRTGDVWLYRPLAHKTAYLGEVLTKYIGAQAQAILMSYLLEKEDTPEAFLFSPADTVRDRNIERRRNRKTLNKKGEVQPSQKNRRKGNPQKQPGTQYTTHSYSRAIIAACKKAGVGMF